MKDKVPIIAISTNTFFSGIGIIRISMGNYGHKCKSIFNIISRKKYVFPRLATKAYFYYKDTIIDEGLILYFPEPNSYNGESIIELHTHGNSIILKKIIENCISNFKKIRIARKGEFTYRAFLNKKFDIFKIKEIENKIFANNKYEILNYIKSKDNVLLNFKKINSNIVKIRIYIENLICSEESFKTKQREKIKVNLIKIKKELNKLKYIKNTNLNKIKVSIVGESNSGKSSLFNNLIKEDFSIVFDKPGTTRNLIKKSFFIKNIKFCIFDTVGIRNTKNEIEKIGIEQTKRNIKKSDLIIYVNKGDIIDKYNNSIIYVVNKLDLFFKKKIKKTRINNSLIISSKFNIGIKFLKKKIYKNILYIMKNKNKNSCLNSNLFVYKNFCLNKINICFILNNEGKIDLLSETLGLIQKKLNFLLSNKDLVKKVLENFCIGK